ncbi:MAG: serine/threonine protein kinase [Polyangiales bacterium]
MATAAPFHTLEKQRDPSASTDRTPDPLIGRVIADRYRIVGHLGRGGMGVVYKVEHLRIGKLMAMKLLTGELSRNRDVVRRFKREALAASRLTSINTVQVWDFGHGDGLTYLVMELVAGDDLGKVLKSEGPMPFRRIAQIAVQVCNSMIEAHDRGIVHRDIKPENILILHAGGSPESDRPEKAEARQLTDLVKVLDFGLAKLHDDDRPHTNDVTNTGAIVGTPFYMSPEQIRGESVDGRADIYALGAVMYRAITGVPPFQANTPMGVLTQHLTEPLIPPHERTPERKIPLEASEIIAKAMSKDKADRYQSAIELREALINYLASTGISGGFLRSGALEAVAATGVPSDRALERIRPSRAEVGEKAAFPATRLEIEAYDRRRRYGAFMIAGLALALAGAIVSVARSYPRHEGSPRASNEEIEPNDDIGHATALTLGTTWKGYIGKRISPDQADADVWSFDSPEGAVEISVGPLPNMPLCAELLDASGNATASFCRPAGKALTIPSYRVDPGRHWLRITQDRAPMNGEKTPVHENVSDTYALRIAVAVSTPGLELEPNDGIGNAQDLAVGDTPIEARIGWRGDRDTFCAGSEGRFVILDRATKQGAPRLEVETFTGGASNGKSLIEDPTHPWKSERFGTGKHCVQVSAAESAVDLDEPYRVKLEAP